MIQRLSNYINTVRAIIYLLKTRKSSFYQALGGLMISALIPLHLPILAGVMVDAMKTEPGVMEYQFSTVSLLNFIFEGPVFLLCAIALLSGLGAYLHRVSRICMSDAFALEVRKMVVQEGSGHASEGMAGNQMSALIRDQKLSRQFLDVFLFQPLTLSVFICAAITFLLFVDHVIGLTTGLAILLFCFVMQAYQTAVQQKEAEHPGHLLEDDNDNILGFAVLQGLFWLSAIVGLAWLWRYGGQAVALDQMSFGMLVTCGGLVVLSFLSLGDRFMILRRPDVMTQSFVNMRQLLMQSVKPALQTTTRSFRISDGRVKIKRLSHQANGQRVLDDISLDLVPRQLTAIVTPDKTSGEALLRLIAKELSPQKGRICLDGQSIEGLSRHELRTHVAFIPERPVFFDGTLLENLRFLCPNASSEEVTKVCDMVFALSHIENLKHGFQTQLGHEGEAFQDDVLRRFAIARAILNQPRILLLDNPLAGLMPNMELAMINTLRRLRGKFTVVVTSRQLDKVKDADQVYRIRDGRLIEQGTPSMLIRRHMLLRDRVGQNLQYCASPF